MKTVAALVRLAVAVLWARARAATSTTGGRVSLAGDFFAHAGSGLLMLVGSLFYAWVGTALIGTLVSRGEIALASSAAAAMADLTCALAVLAALLADGSRTGLDMRPLAPLALPAGEVAIAQVVALLTTGSAALVIWPASLALVAGVAAGSERAALLLAPACAGLAVVAGALAVLARALFAPRGAAVRALWRAVAVIVPIAWSLSPWSPFASLDKGVQAGFTPGSWIGAALPLALRHDPRALLAALGVGLLGFATIALAAPLLARMAQVAEGGSRRLARLPAAARLVWAPPRAVSLLAQGLSSAALIVVIHAALVQREIATLGLDALAGTLAAWIIAATPAPLFAGALGLGGRAAAPALLGARRPTRLLAMRLAWIAAPSALALAALVVWLAALGRSSAALAAAAAGVAALGAGLGAGALASVLAPARLELAQMGDPLWTHGASRLAVPLAQTLAVSPCLALATFSASRPPAAMVIIALSIGFATAVSGLVLARRRLMLRRDRIVEALTS